MKTTKRFLSVFIVCLLVVNIFYVGVQATEVKANEAVQFRGNNQSLGVVDSKTPRTADETTLLWSENIKSGWMNPMPVTVGDYIYLTAKTSDNKWVLQKRSITDGTIVKQENLKSSCGFFSFLSYGEGKIFVPIDKGAIQAFDANTLESLWVTKEITQFYAQSNAPTIYHNGYVYTGLTDGSAKKGMYFCVSAKDEDPTKTDEVKDYTWSYAVPPKFADKEGYYWSGGVIVGDKIIFGGEAGEIVSHDLITNQVYDTFECNEAIRSTIQYDKSTKSIIFTTKSGNIHKLKVNADGTFDDTSHKSVFINPDVTSSPVSFNGRIYVGNGGMGSGASAKFSVLDVNTLDIICQMNMQTQSSPMISTAYATKENKNTVYIYVAKYTSPDEIYCITDFEGNTTPTYTTIAIPTVNNYNTSSLTIDKNGTIYHKNDSGWLYAYGNINSAFTAQDVTNAIKRLPSLQNVTLDDEYIIKQAEYRFNSLSDAEKAKVSSEDKNNLAALKEKVTQLKDVIIIKKKLIEDIDSLPSVITLADRDKIDSLVAIYNSLSQSDKADIKNHDKLKNAKEALDILVENKTVEDIIASINSLESSVNYDSKTSIYSVYGEYLKLSDELKKRITNADKLISLKNKVDATVKEVNDINNSIWNEINPSNITVKDKEKVQQIISRYNKLSEADKKHIKNYDDVLFAQKVIANLEKGNVVSDVFENIMGNPNAEYKVNGVTSNGKEYTITFNGKNVTSPMDFNTEISFSSKNDAKINELAKDAFVISFSHEGKLPGKAKVTIKVDLADGEYSLFHFNEKTQKAEFVQKVTVKNGILSFEITHCSDYFVSKTLSANPSNPNTGDNSAIATSIVLLTLSFGALILVNKKRKTSESL